MLRLIVLVSLIAVLFATPALAHSSEARTDALYRYVNKNDSHYRWNDTRKTISGLGWTAHQLFLQSQLWKPANEVSIPALCVQHMFRQSSLTFDDDNDVVDESDDGRVERACVNATVVHVLCSTSRAAATDGGNVLDGDGQPCRLRRTRRTKQARHHIIATRAVSSTLCVFKLCQLAC
jgi:hypothetical protein